MRNIDYDYLKSLADYDTPVEDVVVKDFYKAFGRAVYEKQPDVILQGLLKAGRVRLCDLNPFFDSEKLLNENDYWDDDMCLLVGRTAVIGKYDMPDIKLLNGKRELSWQFGWSNILYYRTELFYQACDSPKRPLPNLTTCKGLHAIWVTGNINEIHSAMSYLYHSRSGFAVSITGDEPVVSTYVDFDAWIRNVSNTDGYRALLDELGKLTGCSCVNYDSLRHAWELNSNG